MLFLEGKKEWKTHAPSGAKFLLEAISNEEYNTLRKKHRLQDGSFDIPGFTSEFCVLAVKDWQGVGDRSTNQALPCTEENVAKFGRIHCNTVGQFCIDEATALNRFIEEETQAAKNA